MTPDLVAAELQRGVEAHRASRLAEAEAHYRAVLAADAANPDALNLLGVLASAAGNHADAIAFYDRAIASNPQFADAHFNRANSLSAMGRADAAIAAYTQAIALNPRHADARLNLGVAHASAGAPDAAIAAFQAMTGACPQDARGFFNLGQVLARQGQHHQAIAPLRTAMALAPDSVAAAIELADVFEHIGDLEQAEACLRRAFAIDPASVDAQDRLAPLLARAGKFAEAVTAFDDAIASSPRRDDRFVSRLLGLGDTYKRHGDWADAISAYEEALIGQAPSAIAVHGIADVFGAMEWLAGAALLTEHAIALKPDEDRFTYNLALHDLKRGQLATGWEKYEARFKANNVPELSSPPRWNGEDLKGRGVLIWPEQGLGDQILLSSLIPDIVARAGKVIADFDPRLCAVMARSFPTAVIRPHGPNATRDIPADAAFQMPIASLGRFFRGNFEKFPKHSGYLKADPAKRAELRRNYEARAQGRRIVGISWRSANDTTIPPKSAALADLADFLRNPATMFVNLQYGDCAAELAAMREASGIDIHHDPAVDPSGDLDAYFAQVAAMDLVISTSSTCAHVAGALGAPVWLLLPRSGGSMWYWFLHRDDSPWYPSMRIFRQQEIDARASWTGELVKKISAELSQWARAPASPGLPR